MVCSLGILLAFVFVPHGVLLPFNVLSWRYAALYWTCSGGGPFPGSQPLPCRRRFCTLIWRSDTLKYVPLPFRLLPFNVFLVFPWRFVSFDVALAAPSPAGSPPPHITAPAASSPPASPPTRQRHASQRPGGPLPGSQPCPMPAACFFFTLQCARSVGVPEDLTLGPWYSDGPNCVLLPFSGFPWHFVAL